MSMLDPARPTPDQCALSNRESQMIELITRGLTNAEIAEHMQVSINSIKSFIRGAYRKIGADCRAHAIVWGFENGYGREKSTG